MRATGSSSLLLALLLVAVSAIAVSAEKPSAIRGEITKTEDAYFALYNRLNTVRQFDMICRKDRATGSSFLVRICQPRYVLAMQEANASQRMQAAVQSGASSGPANSRGPDVGNSVAAGVSAASVQQDAFNKNMLEVLQNSPELQALGQKRDELQARLQEATKAN
jgi:hypothetical protein